MSKKTSSGLKKAVTEPVNEPNLEVMPKTDPLSIPEQKDLKTQESIIKKGWSTFLDVGNALVTINEKRLYRANYENFKDYVREELGFSRTYAYNLIGSAEVNKQLSSIGDIKVKPLNEGQLRELIPVPVKDRPDAWKAALGLAGDKPLTAKIVKKAAIQFLPKKTNKRKPKKPAPAITIDLGPALELLEKAQQGLTPGKNDAVSKNLAELKKCLEALVEKE